jgi:hypothetical protein
VRDVAAKLHREVVLVSKQDTHHRVSCLIWQAGLRCKILLP